MSPNSAPGPRQRNASTSANNGASVRSVARSLNSSASSRCSPSTRGGKSSIGSVPVQQPRRGHRADAGDARDSRRPHRRRARDSRGCSAGPTPNFARTPSASRIFLPRRSICTTRSPRTHCARSLSGVQMHTFSTRAIVDRQCAPQTPARRRPRARPSARPRRPSPRALPPTDGTARAAPARCPAPVL